MTTSETTRASRWPLYLIGALLGVGVIATALWNVELPYLAFSPGPISDAADSIHVEDTEVYPPEGELLMLTVISQEVNVYEALIAGLDPTIDLVPRQAVRRPGESDEEYRNRVLQQMDDSNFRSVAVALQHLGYELVPSEVVINEILEGVPAGSVLELGDTIKAINGAPITSVGEIRLQIDGLHPGDTMSVTIVREGVESTVTVELAEREDEPGTAMIGVVLGELTRPPFPLEIRAGDVGGPSAGMMHALAIIDTLTEGELTRGNVIAGTGTISMDGSVGNIGGVRQKVVAAEAAGADYILVPEGNYESAITAEHTSIEIVPVATLSEALTFLESLEQT